MRRVRLLENGEEPRHQEDARRHHGRGMNQRADRRGPFHGVGQPGVQRELPRFADRSGEDSQGHPGQRGASQHGGTGRHWLRRLPDVWNVEGVESDSGEVVCLEEQVQDRYEEANVADAGDDERLLGCGGCRGAVVPEADQQIRRHAHQLPERVQLHDVAGEHQAQHRGREQGHVGEIPGKPGIAIHVAHRVNLDQEADGGHDHQHHCRERIDQQAHLYRCAAIGEPVPTLEDGGMVDDDPPKGDDRQHRRRGQRGDGTQRSQKGPAVQEWTDDQGYQNKGAQGKQKNGPD